MMEPEQVKKLIAEGLPCEGLHVQGDGQHFEALIVSSLFEGKSRVKRRQSRVQVVERNCLTRLLAKDEAHFSRVERDLAESVEGLRDWTDLTVQLDADQFALRQRSVSSGGNARDVTT